MKWCPLSGLLNSETVSDSCASITLNYQTQSPHPTTFSTEFLYFGPVFPFSKNPKARYQAMVPVPHSLMKWFKPVNSKHVFPALPTPSCRNQTKSSCPHVLLAPSAFWPTLVLFHEALGVASPCLLGSVTITIFSMAIISWCVDFTISE